jgi:hypothetical protein
MGKMLWMLGTMRLNSTRSEWSLKAPEPDISRRSFGRIRNCSVIWAENKTKNRSMVKFLGVGVSKNSKNQTFVVCNYDPPGNYVGKFAVSVPKVGGF